MNAQAINPAPDLHELIRRRAEEIYFRNGRIPGRDVENWAQAESEIFSEYAANRRHAVVVKLDGVQYVGEYHPQSSRGYTPGEFSSGAPVPVRIEGDKMFLTRPNGLALETTIVHKIE